MSQFAVAYAATAVTFLAIDFVWLSLMASRLYRPQLGNLLLDQPNLVVAGLFYLVYAAGIVVLVVLPAFGSRSLLMALGLGALLGLVAYGTYDITNLATLKGWSVTVTIVDMLWGMTITAVASVAGYLALRTVMPA
ncbi:DUF2177 family protein [Phreatobacter sp.]|uniref:DUF2177 family protein n=1 Tax=Phreatobacter sp. TaxID=1966341 RepID=UPI003F725FA0